MNKNNKKMILSKKSKRTLLSKKNEKTTLNKKNEKLYYNHITRQKLADIKNKKLQNLKENTIKIKIKDKLLNYLLKKGNKRTSEKILLKSIKELQKCSKKHSLDIIKVAISLSVPIFKIYTFTDRKRKKRKKKVQKIKRIPIFLMNKESRKSLALKFIANTKNKKQSKMHLLLKNEFLLNAQNKGLAVQLKYELHKEASKYKNLIRYYRWKIA